MLFRLPEDVSVTVLRDWLASHAAVSALDIACSPSVRLEFLNLLRDQRFKLTAEAVESTNENAANYIHWLGSRMMRLSKLDVLAEAGCAAYCSIDAQVLGSVEAMAFINEDKGFNSEELQSLLELCKSLTDIDCSFWTGMEDADLFSIADNSHLPLRIFSAGANCSENEVTCKGYGRIAYAFRASLQELCIMCGYCIPEEFLILISKSCRQLTKIEMTVGGDERTRLAVCDFFESYSSLRHIQLQMAKDEGEDEDEIPFADDIIVESIIAENIHLRCLLVPSLSVCFEGSMSAMTDCKELEQLLTSSLVYVVKRTGCGKKEATLSGGEDAAYFLEQYPSSFDELLTSCPYPIANLSTAFGVNDTNLAAIRDIAGPTLKELELELAEDASAAVIDDLFAHCPELQELRMVEGECVTDSCLLAISTSCLKLTELYLENLENISDDGVVQLLQSIGGRLTVLCLCCDQLTDKTLRAIIANCSELDSLAFNTFEADVLCELFVRPNALPKTKLRLPAQVALQLLGMVDRMGEEYAGWNAKIYCVQ